MADTWDDAEMGGPVDSLEDSQPQQIQEKKINKKKLSELDSNGKMLQFFMRDPKTRAIIPCTEIKDVPKDVATICSDYIYKKVVSKGEPYLMLDDSLGLGLAPYKFVFDWIKTCAEERSVASAPEVKDLITDDTGMKPFIDAMVVAHKLQIPHASFGKFLVRKLLPLAREHLIDLDTVRKAYDTGDEVYNELEIRELCVKSIFEHWFAWKLDGDEDWKLDYMCELAEMRENIPELHKDLRKAVDDKDAYLKESKKKRQQERELQNSGEAGETGETGGDGGNDGWADPSIGAAGDGGEDTWANAGTGSSGGGADWTKDGAATKGTNDWADEVNHSVSDASGEGGGSGNWADDMNEDGFGQTTQSFNPAPVPVTGGW